MKKYLITLFIGSIFSFNCYSKAHRYVSKSNNQGGAVIILAEEYDQAHLIALETIKHIRVNSIINKDDYDLCPQIICPVSKDLTPSELIQIRLLLGLRKGGMISNTPNPSMSESCIVL